MSPECLDIIADAAEPYGDARFALEMLEKAANMAEARGDDRINPDYVRLASASVHTDISE